MRFPPSFTCPSVILSSSNVTELNVHKITCWLSQFMDLTNVLGLGSSVLYLVIASVYHFLMEVVLVQVATGKWMFLGTMHCIVLVMLASNTDMT